MKEYNTVVIGLGAVGSAALYFLSQRDPNVLGIDRFDPPHSMGSSHGETRISRLAVGEGKEYVKYARRSQEIWRDLEQRSGERLFNQVGGLLVESGSQPWIKYGGASFFESTCQIAKEEGITHHLLDAVELKKQYPGFQLDEKARGYFESEAGFVFPEKVIQVQLNLAEKNGAKIRINQAVTSLEQNNGWVEISLAQEKIRAKKVILTAGGWVKDFLGEDAQEKFKICRQVLYWVKLEKNSPLKDLKSVFMWGYGSQSSDFLYGFPSLDRKSIKIATEQFEEVGHPDDLIRAVDRREAQRFWEEKLKGKFLGFEPEILKSEVCFYTMTEDAKFVIGPHPQMDRVNYVSACSGHGFKHASALGEQLAQEGLC
ncbi:MAG: N-methyl-L-tryptophan oxidase [Bacteroidota bacterium]